MPPHSLLSKEIEKRRDFETVEPTENRVEIETMLEFPASFKWRKVQVLGGLVKDAVPRKESKGGKRMAVRVRVEKTSEALRRGDHGRDGLHKRGELRLEELESCGVSRAAKVA